MTYLQSSSLMNNNYTISAIKKNIGIRFNLELQIAVNKALVIS